MSFCNEWGRDPGGGGGTHAHTNNKEAVSHLELSLSHNRKIQPFGAKLSANNFAMEMPVRELYFGSLMLKISSESKLHG